MKNNIEAVQNLQLEITNNILSFMKERNHNIIEFDTNFRVFVSEETYDGDYIQVPLLVRYLYEDGTIGTEDGDSHLRDLNPYEVAYILDTLQNGEYTVDEEAPIDTESNL